MTYGLQYPNYSYQFQANNGGNAAASAFAGNGFAAASASASAGGYPVQQQQNPGNMLQGMAMIFAGMDMMDDGAINGSILKQMMGGPQQAQQPMAQQPMTQPQFAPQMPQNQYNPQQAQQQQPQNPMQQMMQMFMQMMQMMMQMMMKMMGMNPQQAQQQQPNAAAAAAAGPNGAAAAAAAGQPAIQQPAIQQPGTANNAAAAATATGANGAQGGTPLSQIPPDELAAIKGDDINAKGKKNENKYVFYNGHLYAETGKNHYKAVKKLPQGKNHLYLSKNANIQQGGAGGYTMSAAAAAASNADGSSSAAAAVAISQSPGTVATVTSKEKTGSPLILDTNKDGKVSAEQGKGVDVDGDGKADGAATGGDKMLAMGDLDGDGKITGKEVFGNETVDPFTGQKLNAQNGFDALNQVAKSAEKHTGIKCVDENGEVDLQKLKQALEMSGKGSLGMISDNNNTTLEGLGDAAKINTTNYQNQQQTGAVQHNQLGSYTDANGKTHKVDDVWFQLA